jgi:hypothetical protein
MSKTQVIKPLLEMPPIRCAKEYSWRISVYKKARNNEALKVAQILRAALVPQVALA